MKEYFHNVGEAAGQDGVRELELTEPAAMRVLAHPARWRILGQLQLHGPATATACSAVAGLSPSACSYHLRVLARWGFVESAPAADGRERPWRARVRGIRFSAGTRGGPEWQAAARVLRNTLLERDAQVLQTFLTVEDTLDSAWREAALFLSSVLAVTPDELTALELRLAEVLEPYLATERRDPPPGARLVHFAAFGLPRSEG